MFLRIITLILFTTTTAFASDERLIKELFSKYDKIMIEKRVEFVDEVFSQKFLKENEGRSSFINKIKSATNNKKFKVSDMSWRKSKSGDIYFAKSKSDTDSEFILVKEAGKLKIDGTLGDSN